MKWAGEILISLLPDAFFWRTWCAMTSYKGCSESAAYRSRYTADSGYIF